MTGKVRKTLTLDPEVVAALGEDPAALSSTVNEILRAEVARREQRMALGALVDALENDLGPVDPEDLAHFRTLLS